MSDQFNRQKITREIARIKNASEQAINEVAEMRRVFNEAYARVVQERDSFKIRAEKAEAEIERLRRELADLKEFAYERAPKIAIEEANKQIKPLKEEVERLCSELGYIANAKRRNFTDAEEFRDWAQNRAQHALGLKPGELTVRKERA